MKNLVGKKAKKSTSRRKDMCTGANETEKDSLGDLQEFKAGKEHEKVAGIQPADDMRSS